MGEPASRTNPPSLKRPQRIHNAAFADNNRRVKTKFLQLPVHLPVRTTETMPYAAGDKRPLGKVSQAPPPCVLGKRPCHNQYPSDDLSLFQPEDWMNQPFAAPDSEHAPSMGAHVKDVTEVDDARPAVPDVVAWLQTLRLEEENDNGSGASSSK